MFTGANSFWDDPRIETLNPDLHLPHQRITPYYRTDPSGENYLLSDYLMNTDPHLPQGLPETGESPESWGFGHLG